MTLQTPPQLTSSVDHSSNSFNILAKKHQNSWSTLHMIFVISQPLWFIANMKEAVASSHQHRFTNCVSVLLWSSYQSYIWLCKNQSPGRWICFHHNWNVSTMVNHIMQHEHAGCHKHLVHSWTVVSPPSAWRITLHGLSFKHSHQLLLLQISLFLMRFLAWICQRLWMIYFKSISLAFILLLWWKVLLIPKIFIDQSFRTFVSAICSLIRMPLWV